MAAASEIVSVGSIVPTNTLVLRSISRCKWSRMWLVARVKRARLLADDHQLADDRREHFAVAFQLAAEFLAAADGVLQVAHALLEWPGCRRPGRFAQRFGQVVAGLHQAAQHFHQLQHGDVAQPIAEHRRICRIVASIL